MSIALYMDVNVPGPITDGLRRRAVLVMTAQEDGADRLSDRELLDRATSLGYAVFTLDTDFLVEAARRQRAGEEFAGVIYAHMRDASTGRTLDDLELLAKVYDPPNMMNRVEYLPL